MHELLEMNKRGEYPHSLTEFALEEGPDEVDETYQCGGQDSLTRFDEQRRRQSGPAGTAGHKNKSGGRRVQGVRKQRAARGQGRR